MSNMLRLLVVEANQRVAEALEASLPGQGFDLKMASLGHDALSLCQAAPFDFILIDDNLPDMSGPSLAGALRAEKIPSPILFMTGADSDIPEEYLIRKPFRPRLLAERIFTILMEQRRSVASRTKGWRPIPAVA